MRKTGRMQCLPEYNARASASLQSKRRDDAVSNKPDAGCKPGSLRALEP